MNKPKNVIVTKVDGARWRLAQQFETEFAERTNDTGDDWNKWWKQKFDSYKVLKGKSFSTILEVGCGPHTNIRLILPLVKASHLYLEDPLVPEYLSFNSTKTLVQKSWSGKTVTTTEGSINMLGELLKNPKYRVDLSSSPLEDLPYKDRMMDLIVCINVLDHVADLKKCMNEMDRVLKKNGVLIMGQDLSNEEDFKQAPDSWEDIGHPIKVDESTMNSYLDKYKRLFYKILPRKAGRNPVAHYGTYLFIGKKI